MVVEWAVIDCVINSSVDVSKFLTCIPSLRLCGGRGQNCFYLISFPDESINSVFLTIINLFLKALITLLKASDRRGVSSCTSLGRISAAVSSSAYSCFAYAYSTADEGFQKISRWLVVSVGNDFLRCYSQDIVTVLFRWCYVRFAGNDTAVTTFGSAVTCFKLSMMISFCVRMILLFLPVSSKNKLFSNDFTRIA